MGKRGLTPAQLRKAKAQIKKQSRPKKRKKGKPNVPKADPRSISQGVRRNLGEFKQLIPKGNGLKESTMEITPKRKRTSTADELKRFGGDILDF